MLLCHQVYEEFCSSSQALSVEKLIETFIQAKSTGTEKPGELACVTDMLCLVAYAP